MLSIAEPAETRALRASNAAQVSAVVQAEQSRQFVQGAASIWSQIPLIAGLAAPRAKTEKSARMVPARRFAAVLPPLLVTGLA